MQEFEPPSTQHNGFNISQLKNIVVPGENTCSYSVVVITVDFEIYVCVYEVIHKPEFESR